MQRLEFSGAVRPIYGSLGVKRLIVMLETARSFETSVRFREISWYRILEDSSPGVNTGVHKSQVPGHPGE